MNFSEILKMEHTKPKNSINHGNKCKYLISWIKQLPQKFKKYNTHHRYLDK